MKKTFASLTTFCILSAALIFHVPTAKGEIKSLSTNTSEEQLTKNAIPAKVSSWMDAELNKAKRKTLLTKEQFFTRDSAKVVGYIKGYRPNLGFKTVNVDATNVLTREGRPIISEIDSMGRFICTIPMNYPKKLTISFDKKLMSLYLEPGQVLALSFDWDDCVKTDGFRDVKNPASLLLFRGPLAKLNYDLMSFQLKDIGYTHYWIEKTPKPEQYLAVMDSIFTLNDALVKQALKEGKISKKVIEIQKNESLIKSGFYLIDYAIAKNDKGEHVPANYYNMLQRMPLNDPSSAISGWYAGFINRLEENPVMQKGYRNIGSFKSMSEVYLKFLNKKDSLLKTDFKLPSSFSYEVTKIRRLSSDIKSLGKNEAYAYYAKMSEGIKNPFLRQEGLRVMKRQFGKEETRMTDRGISIVPLSDKPLPKWVPLSLSKGKDAEIFSKLIAPYKGKYLFVDFWGLLCGPCRWGIEEKKSVREKYKNNGVFEFVFITCPKWTPDKNACEKYAKEQGLEHSIIVSDDDFNYVQQLFRFTGVPHYLFIDPKGKILDVDFEMYIGFEEARKWIQANHI
jgi:thiol-disulfide isomerase/thioredoxin